jgi:hypothetical protein
MAWNVEREIFKDFLKNIPTCPHHGWERRGGNEE